MRYSVKYSELPYGEILVEKTGKEYKFKSYIRYRCPHCGNVRVTQAWGANAGAVLTCREATRYKLGGVSEKYFRHDMHCRFLEKTKERSFTIWNEDVKLFKVDKFSPLMKLVKRLNKEKADG